MKTYLMSLKRAEHGNVAIRADSFEEALAKVNDEDFDTYDVNLDFGGYDDERWAYDPEWGTDIIEEDD